MSLQANDIDASHLHMIKRVGVAVTLLIRIREVLGSNIGPEHRLFWLRLFVVFFRASRQMLG
jgi:hypothetical protein